MKPLMLVMSVALVAPFLTGCGKHLSDPEKKEWIEYWTEVCKCQAPGVDRAQCQAKVHRPEAKGTFSQYSNGDRELISNGGIRCVGGAPHSL